MFVCPPPRQRSQLIRPVQFVLVPPVIPGESKNQSQNYAATATSDKPSSSKKDRSRKGHVSSKSKLETKVKSEEVQHGTMQSSRNTKHHNSKISSKNRSPSRLGSWSEKSPSDSKRCLKLPNATSSESMSKNSTAQRGNSREKSILSSQSQLKLSNHKPRQTSADVLRPDASKKSSKSKSNKKSVGHSKSVTANHKNGSSRTQVSKTKSGNESLKYGSQCGGGIGFSTNHDTLHKKQDKNATSKCVGNVIDEGHNIIKSDNYGQKLFRSDRTLGKDRLRDELIEKSNNSILKKNGSHLELPCFNHNVKDETHRRHRQNYQETRGVESKEADFPMKNAMKSSRSKNISTKTASSIICSEKKLVRENTESYEDNSKFSTIKRFEMLNPVHVSRHPSDNLTSECSPDDCPIMSGRRPHQSQNDSHAQSEKKTSQRKKFSLKRFIKRERTGGFETYGRKKVQKQEEVSLDATVPGEKTYEVASNQSINTKNSEQEFDNKLQQQSSYKNSSSGPESREKNSSNIPANIRDIEKSQRNFLEGDELRGQKLDVTDKAYKSDSKKCSRNRTLTEKYDHMNGLSDKTPGICTKININPANITQPQLKSSTDKMDSENSKPINLPSEKCRYDFGDFSWLACTDFSGEYPFRVSSPRSPPSIRSGLINSPPNDLDKSAKKIKNRIPSPPDLVKGLDSHRPISPNNSFISSNFFDGSKLMHDEPSPKILQTNSSENQKPFEPLKNGSTDSVVTHTVSSYKDGKHLGRSLSISSDSSESSSESDESCSDSSSSSSDDEQDQPRSAELSLQRSLQLECCYDLLPASNDVTGGQVDARSGRDFGGAVDRDLSIFTAEYLSELQQLQHRIMTSTDCGELERVFALVAETGSVVDSNNHYDFDLCGLDQRVIRKIQRCLLMI